MILSCIRLFQLFSIFLVLFGLATANVCHPYKDSCTCRTPYGYEYSLQALDNITAPAFSIDGSEANSSFVYEYSPCTKFTRRGCKDALICQTNKKASYLNYNLGMASTFQAQFVGNNLEFHYRGSEGRHSRIILICDHSATTPTISHFTETIPTWGSLYTATLTSMHACPIHINITYPTMVPTTETKKTTQVPVKASTKSAPLTISCPACVSYEKELVLAIIVLLIIQLVSYIAIGFAWYRKFYAQHVGTYNHKSFKNLEQPLEDDNRYPNY